jgi:hypothetical protein
MDANEPVGTSDSTTAVLALLDGDEASAEKKWTNLSDRELDEEIEAFRRGIEEISKALEASGVEICQDEQNAADGGVTADVEVRSSSRFKAMMVPSRSVQGLNAANYPITCLVNCVELAPRS